MLAILFKRIPAPVALVILFTSTMVGTAAEAAPPTRYDDRVHAEAMARAINGDPSLDQHAVVLPGSSASLPPPATGFRHGEWVVVSYDIAPPAIGSSPGQATSDDPQILSASGCSPLGSVYANCIRVKGAGLVVNEWKTDGYVNLGGCDQVCPITYQVHYIVNGGTVLIRYKSNYTVPARYSDTRPYGPFRYSDGTKLCNAWPQSVVPNNKPCITVTTDDRSFNGWILASSG